VRGGAANSAERQGAPRVQPSSATGGATVPPKERTSEEFFFVVSNNPQESRLERLAPADLQAAQKYVPILTALTTQDLTACLRDETPGTEIWRTLVLAAMAALLLEIALSRWIARRRGANVSVPVAFGKEPMDVQSFRDRAKEMLTVPTPEFSREPKASASRSPTQDPRPGTNRSTSQPANQSTD
jgi:hypothetical protein